MVFPNPVSEDVWHDEIVPAVLVSLILETLKEERLPVDRLYHVINQKQATTLSDFQLTVSHLLYQEKIKLDGDVCLSLK